MEKPKPIAQYTHVGQLAIQESAVTTVAATSDRKAKVSFYRPELDALRFCAFFAVFLFHMPRRAGVLGNALMQAGVFGVDLFFTLSAYLITELLLQEKESFGALDVKSFYLRRIFRIWPLYFFFIALALLPALNPGQTFTWPHVASFLLLSGNWGIIALGWPLRSVVTPLWTISIEEQFYVLWPPIVRKLSREQIARAAMGMLLISSMTRVLMILVHGGTNSVWCNTLARLDPIAAGILLAIVLHGKIPKLRISARAVVAACSVFALSLVANFWEINGPETLEWIPTMLGFPIVALSCSMILIAALGMPAVPKWLVYLGKISYGLYVYHALGIFLSDRMDIHGVVRLPVALAFTILVSAVSYRVLESPFLKLKRRFAHVESRPV